MAVSPIIGAHRREGQKLLHRQCWNWGRDIERPEGNLLLEAGFLKRRPPEGAAGSSCYTLTLSDGDILMVWGFGLLYGTLQKGGVFLNRYEFHPLWLPLEMVQEPIWRPDMIPAAQTPASPRVPVDLTVAAIRRIADYEEWALARCGLEYRRAILRQWKRPSERLPPQTVPQAWRSLADAIDGQPHLHPPRRTVPAADGPSAGEVRG